MASVYDLKPAFQNLLRPLVLRLKNAGATPNQITLATLVLSLAMGTLLFVYSGKRWPLFTLPAFLFARMALNAIDGMLAREHGLATPAGAMLNEIGDVCSDAAVYLPFARLPAASPPLVFAIVLLAVISEMTGVLGVALGGPRRQDGPMGKSDRAAAFGLLALLLGLNALPPRWLNGAFAAILAALVLTIACRWRNALRVEA